MLKFILAALAIALAWVLVLALGFSMTYAIYATAVVVVILIGILVFRWIQAWQSARRIEKGLSAQADKHVDGVRPEDQAKIREMKAEFTRALGSLKSSKLGGGGMSALYALPWYMIIGPPGAGKSTAIGNSGLKFPSAKRLRGVGGTRNCDWWLANEAVILDTAGRYATQGEDNDEWVEFLDLLRRGRPKKPLNGIMIGISVEDIAGVEEDEVIDVAQRLKERIDEVTERLKMIFPIYVVLTKCDCLPGFVDTFEDLKQKERGQIWGFTLSQNELTAQAAGELSLERFDELQATLERRVVHRLARERRSASRERIFQFPQHFASLRDNLRILIDTLFAPDVYQEIPLLRGVYFTSGTQDGRRIDRIRHAIARSLGVEPRLPPDEEIGDRKSYFMRDVFSRVIFPDKNLAVRTKEENKRQTTRMIGLAAGAVIGAILLAAFPIYTASKQRETVESIHAIVKSIHEKRAEEVFPFAEIAQLREKMPGLCEPKGDRSGWLNDSGLYNEACGLYVHLMKKAVITPLITHNTKELRRIALEQTEESGLTGEAYETLCYGLKVHLLLTEGDVDNPGDETALKVRRDWLAAQILRAWDDDSAEDEIKKAHAALYMDLIAANVSTRPPLKELRDDAGLKLAREAITQTPAEQKLLEQIVRDVAKKMGKPLKLEEIIDHKQAPYESFFEIERAYTREGWDKMVRKRVFSSLEDCEPWVIGVDSDPVQQMAKLQQLYYRKYIEAWTELVTRIEFVAPISDIDSLKMIEALTAGPETPLHKLLVAVGNNAQLEIPPEGPSMAGKLGGALKKQLMKKVSSKVKSKTGVAIPASDGGVQEAPEPVYIEEVREGLLPLAEFGYAVTAVSAGGGKPGVPLDTYISELEALRPEFQARVVQKPEEAEQFVIALDGALGRVNTLISKNAGNYKPVFEKLLLSPLQHLKSAAQGQGQQRGNDEWCNNVYEPFKSMRNLFPFNPSAREHAALDRFTELFKPNGQLWSYYQRALASEIAQSGAKFEFRGEGASKYDRRILEFLMRAHELTKLMFVNEVPKVSMQVTLRLVPKIQSVKLEVGGQKIEHEKGIERPQPIEWPGKGDNWTATVRVKGPKGASEEISEGSNGEWQFFQLLASGELTRKSARDIDVRWKMRNFDDEELRITVKFTTDSPIFGLEERGATTQKMAPFFAVAKAFPSSVRKGAKSCGK